MKDNIRIWAILGVLFLFILALIGVELVKFLAWWRVAFG